MTKLILMIGAATIIGAAPASAAKPGNGQGHKAQAAKQAGKAHVKGSRMHGNHVLRDRNRNGLDDRDEALAHRYGGALCPPGLAKKSPSCIPPGQAKRLFREGQRIPQNYRYYTPYDDIPFVLRDRYELNDDYRYIYRDNVIYRVDPRTNLITSIIDAIL